MQTAVNTSNQIDLSSLRIAISTDLGITTVSDEVNVLFNRFVDDHLTHVKQVTEHHPDLTDAHTAFDTLRANVFATGLEPILDDFRDVIKPEVLWNADAGLELTSLQIRSALRKQGLIVSNAAQFMRHTDVLICPAVSLTSAPAHVRYPGEPEGLAIPEYYRWLAIAYATTMTTLPIITIPVGTTKNGIPFAIQLVGKPWADAKVLQIAHKIEQLVGYDHQPVDPICTV